MDLKQTILIVDDSENDVFLLRAAFKKAELDCALHHVHNGEEAVAYLKGEGIYGDRNLNPLPSAMLLDLNMPMKNGFDVLLWLRTEPLFKCLSIHILTASPRLEDVQRAFDLGANSYLVKPRELKTLVDMIRCLGGWLQLNHFPPDNQLVKR